MAENSLASDTSNAKELSRKELILVEMYGVCTRAWVGEASPGSLSLSGKICVSMQPLSSVHSGEASQSGAV